jgi:hypothetical protein
MVVRLLVAFLLIILLRVVHLMLSVSRLVIHHLAGRIAHFVIFCFQVTIHFLP